MRASVTTAGIRRMIQMNSVALVHEPESRIEFTQFKLLRVVYGNQGDSEAIREVHVDCGGLTLILSRQEVLKLVLWTGITK